MNISDHTKNDYDAFKNMYDKYIYTIIMSTNSSLNLRVIFSCA